MSSGGSAAARDARAEAQAVAGDGLAVRVLEPSPPSVDDGVWFADDPVAVGTDAGGRPVLSPVPTGDIGWGAWLVDHPEHTSWAAERWLAAYRRLGPLPAGLAGTRLALHRLAVYVVSPARRRANGKIALRWTLGGFGTPFFGDDEQVRVDMAGIAHQAGGGCRTVPVTSLADAAAAILGGPPDVEWAKGFDVPEPGPLDAPLAVDPAAATFLGDWYGFAWSVLETLRSDTESVQPSRVQLWPEHFDAAFDCLPATRRATFGASPGDHATPEPYLYVVSPSVAEVPSPLWNATAFEGAILPFGDLVAAPDQRAAALEFFRSRRVLLIS